mmetsp:Transcript_12975/g.39266  ORF Transcript_12975/g.39266 Transcript_12975/m.39266 type:complete len:437 (-) Transcript_12975:585-1895(-)
MLRRSSIDAAAKDHAPPSRRKRGKIFTGISRYQSWIGAALVVAIVAAAMLSDSWEMRSGITKLVQGDSSDGLDQLESLWDEPLTKIIKGTTDDKGELAGESLLLPTLTPEDEAAAAYEAAKSTKAAIAEEADLIAEMGQDDLGLGDTLMAEDLDVADAEETILRAKMVAGKPKKKKRAARVQDQYENEGVQQQEVDEGSQQLSQEMIIAAKVRAREASARAKRARAAKATDTVKVLDDGEEADDEEADLLAAKAALMRAQAAAKRKKRAKAEALMAASADSEEDAEVKVAEDGILDATAHPRAAAQQAERASGKRRAAGTAQQRAASLLDVTDDEELEVDTDEEAVMTANRKQRAGGRRASNAGAVSSGGVADVFDDEEIKRAAAEDEALLAEIAVRQRQANQGVRKATEGLSESEEGDGEEGEEDYAQVIKPWSS